MKRSKSTPQVKPKDKPNSYWMEQSKEVRDHLSAKLAKNPQKEREDQELNSGKLEEEPEK